MTPSAATPGGRVRLVALALVGAALLASPAPALAITSTGTPTLTSSNASPTLAKAGDVLTCSPGSFSVTPDSRSWWWKRGTAILSGNTTSQYVVQDDDAGHSIACSVTATQGVDQASSPYSAEVTIPALPTATFGRPTQGATATDTLTSGGTWTLPWTLATGTLTGCALDGLTVLCSGASYGINASNLTNKADHTFSVTARNAAGATATTTKTFRVAIAVPPKLSVAEQGMARIDPGDVVDLSIETDTRARVACTVNGAPVTCSTTSVRFPASLPTSQRPSDIVVVTATNDDGTTTVTRAITVTGNQKLRMFPNPLLAEAGTPVRFWTDRDFHFWADTPSAYSFRGAIPGITWTAVNPSGAFSDGTEIRFTAPAKVGTYRAELRWGAGGFAKDDDLVLRTFTADQITDTLTFEDVADAKKPLKCPGKGPYAWYLNRVLRFQTDAPYLPATVDLTKTIVDCVSTDPTTRLPLSTKALVAADGTRLTAAPTGTTVTLVISRSSRLALSYRTTSDASKASVASTRAKTAKQLGSVKVKVRKGRAKIALPAKVRAKLRGRRLQIDVSIVGKNGKPSPALTLDAR